MKAFIRTAGIVLGHISPCACFPQYFAPLGPGCSYGQVYDLLSVGDWLYIAGDFAGTGDTAIVSKGILSWNGTNLEQVGCGLYPCDAPQTWNMVVPTRSLAYWEGELYAAGDFHQVGDMELEAIARFNGTEWEGVGGGMDGPVRSLRAYPDGLYAAGWFNNAGGTPAEGLARWDGEQWHSVHDLPLLFPSNPINFINDVAIMGERIYIAGNFFGQQEDTIVRIAQWDGEAWTRVGDGFWGGLTQILKLEVHDSLLYIAGAFADTGQYGHPLNPASGIVAWDGEDWVELGTGTDGANIPWVTDMAWHDDTLYVCGDFNRIGGAEAGGLARWDGEQWCALLPSPPGAYGISCLTFFNDTLHLGGGLVYMGTDSVNRVAKWMGGGHVEECGDAVGIPPLDGAEPGGMALYPNPAGETSFLSWSSALRVECVEVLAADGRTAATFRPNAQAQRMAISLEGLAPGLYTVRALTGTGWWSGRLVKEAY